MTTTIEGTGRPVAKTGGSKHLTEARGPYYYAEAHGGHFACRNARLLDHLPCERLVICAQQQRAECAERGCLGGCGYAEKYRPDNREDKHAQGQNISDKKPKFRSAGNRCKLTVIRRHLGRADCLNYDVSYKCDAQNTAGYQSAHKDLTHGDLRRSRKKNCGAAWRYQHGKVFRRHDGTEHKLSVIPLLFHLRDQQGAEHGCICHGGA